MDFEQEIRRLVARTSTLITRATLMGSGAGKVLVGSVRWLGKRTSSGVQVLQPHGLFFKVPPGAEGVAVGNRSAMSLVGAARRSDSPAGDEAEGEGGLYYAGTYKVFLAEDGTIALGDKEPEDWAALASLVDARISALQAAFDAHIHVTTATIGASGTPGVLSPPANTVGPQASVASAVVKCM